MPVTARKVWEHFCHIFEETVEGVEEVVISLLENVDPEKTWVCPAFVAIPQARKKTVTLVKIIRDCIGGSW